MADFLYAYGGVRPQEEVRRGFYAERTNAAPGLDLFFNEGTVVRVTEGDDSLTVLGYLYDTGGAGTMRDVLHRFSERGIAELKQRLAGQWLMIVRKGGFLYLFSDFLQSRPIYYDAAARRAGSCFASLYRASRRDDYKAFEWLAMRRCLYPAWLGEGTLDGSVSRLPAYKYLVVDLSAGKIEARDLNFEIDNRKISRLSDLAEFTLAAMRRAVRHPDLKQTAVRSTITGGFDSRLAAALVAEYYPQRDARIAQWKDGDSLDRRIAARVASQLGEHLEVHYTDPHRQMEAFYAMTDALTPRENGVMTQMLLAADASQVGFGGVFGTELYTVFPFGSADELAEAYLLRARSVLKGERELFARFGDAVRDELRAVGARYRLAEEEPRDRMRIFQLLVTGTFAAPLAAAANLRGRQFELFGAYPVIEAGLRAPYSLLGSKWTLGRFYLIPKTIMQRLDRRVAAIDTTHFCPMRPFGIASLPAYLAGRFRRRRYYRQRAAACEAPRQLTLRTEGFEYVSDEWFEGFLNTYYR